MSYKKIKIISPDTVRNPEVDYVYLGWGEVEEYSFTGPWIKESDGTVSVISGGTGGGGSTGSSGTSGSSGRDGTSGTSGGGGDSYWSDWSTLGILYTDGYTLMSRAYIGGGDTSVNADILNVAGAITLSNTTKTNDGTIRYNTSGKDFEGYNGSQWKSLTSGSFTANDKEFMYNNNGELTGDSRLLYGNSGIGVNIADPKSDFEVNGSFGTKTSNISSNTTLDSTYHTLICDNSLEINLTLPKIEDSVNREYVICRYGLGNIIIETSTSETQYTEYISFYGTSGNINFDDSNSLPAGASDKVLLYSVTVRPVINFPTTGDATWVVTNFSSSY